MEKSKPPLDDQLELSVFGAGVGESIVVHLGNKKWIVVDSCCNEAGEPIAIEYLQEMGVAVERDVKLVVVTHWHDDHVRGIADVVDAATSAEVVCSGALLCKEFFSLIRVANGVKLVEHTSGVSEFEKLLEVLKDRRTGQKRIGPHHWASAHQLLLNEGAGQLQVMALSPSAATVTAATQRIGSLFPTKGPKRRIPSVEPNDLSVVLVIISGNMQFLLGGDLENTGDPRRGWNAIIASKIRPISKSAVYKIAHHGSLDAHNDDIWTALLDRDPLAVVTPFSALAVPLPTGPDIDRIKALTPQAYCSAPTGKRPQRRRGVDSTINNVAISRRAIPWKPGHVRLRVPLTGGMSDIQVEFEGGAGLL